MTEPHYHPGQQTLPGFGKATTCQAYGVHRPVPLRYIWHHVLPLGAGGKTEATNLVQLCDSCHYTIHIGLWNLANKQLGALQGLSRGQIAIARRGFDAAQALGTLSQIPKEAA